MITIIFMLISFFFEMSKILNTFKTTTSICHCIFFRLSYASIEDIK